MRETASDFQRQRIAIGVLHSSDDLCICIAALSENLPASARFFVMLPAAEGLKEVKEILENAQTSKCAGGHPIITLCRQDDPVQGAADGQCGESEGGGTRAQLLRFDMWLDRKSSAQLLQGLNDGELLLFAPVQNARQETHAYSILSKYATGRIQLHDLPGSGAT